MIVERSDTFVKVPLKRARTLFAELQELSNAKRDADSLLAIRAQTIENGKHKERELKESIAQLEIVIGEKETRIGNLEVINKNNKKKGRQRMIYAGLGGIATGVVTGILIAK